MKIRPAELAEIELEMAPNGDIRNVQRNEKAGDKSFRRIISKLFSGNYDALEVLKLKDVVEKLEGAINAFETVAKRVEQIAVKES